MNKILRLVCQQADFKKIVSIGFFAAFFAVFLSAGTTQASFWDWFNLNKTDNNSQQQQAAVANAETTYKWVNNGLVSESDGRYTGSCSTKTLEKTSTCNSSNKGNKVYDGTDRGSSYKDTGHAWPIYEGENTSTATEYTYSCSGLTKRTGGTVNEWECKSSDSTTTSSSSSSSATLTAKTGDAYNITSNSATIYGTINPQGENVSVYFKYRKDSESSGATKTTSWTSTGSKSNDVITGIKISDLSSGTKYVYRFYAYNYTTGKTIQGDLKSFTTSGGSSSSSLSSSNSSSVSSGNSSSSSSSSSSSVQQYTLKVKISGAGKITSSGGSNVINCKKSIDSKGKSETSGDCSVKLNKGESVTLTPSTPSSQYEFATWAEACRGSQRLSSCAVIMNGNKTVSATFNKKAASGEETVAVSVRKTGKGVGKVVSINSKGNNISGINCGADCSENYKKICEGTSEGRGCSLTYFRATAEKGSTFSGWGGDCLTFKNKKDQCYVILDGNKTVNASFNEGSDNTTGKYFDLTVTVSEGGTVATTDSKISCDSVSSPCKHSYGKNGTVTLKVTPNSGYALGDYSGCSKSGNVKKGVLTCKVKMTQNRNVTINFKASGTTSSSSSSKTSSSSASANHTASNGEATNTTSTSATLNGTVNPKGENVSYMFSYGKKGVSGAAKNTSWKSAGSGSNDVSVSANISGLSSGTEYYYWITAYSYATKAYVSGAYTTSTREYFTTSGGSSSSSLSSSSSSSSQTTTSAYKLKVTVQGNGKIEDNYSKISCGSNMACEATYSKGQVIRIKTEDADSTGASYNTKVESWSGGGCSGTSNSCDITMDGYKEITIKFVSK